MCLFVRLAVCLFGPFVSSMFVRLCVCACVVDRAIAFMICVCVCLVYLLLGCVFVCVHGCVLPCFCSMCARAFASCVRVCV